MYLYIFSSLFMLKIVIERSKKKIRNKYKKHKNYQVKVIRPQYIIMLYLPVLGSRWYSHRIEEILQINGAIFCWLWSVDGCFLNLYMYLYMVINIIEKIQIDEKKKYRTIKHRLINIFNNN